MADYKEKVVEAAIVLGYVVVGGLFVTLFAKSLLGGDLMGLAALL